MRESVTDNVVGASKLLGHISTEGEALEKSNLVSKLPEEMEKVACRALERLGKLHWIAVGFSVIAFALERVRQGSSNFEKCVELLDTIFDLTMFDRRMPKETENLNKAVLAVVDGVITRCSCITQQKLCKDLFASTDDENLKRIGSVIQEVQRKLTPMTTADIQARIPRQHFVSEYERPAHPVGMDDRVEEVIELLDMRGEGQRRALIVHGFGGIGKTTLANCVMSQLGFSGLRHSRIELDEKQSDVRSYQQTPCTYLTADTPHSEDSSEGRDKVLERESTFIYIDNALSETRLKELSPSDLCLPSESRMLVTMHVSPDQIDAVAVARHGFPLLLQVYARYLAHHGDPEACRRMLAAPSKGDISYTDEHLVVDGALVNIGSHDNIVVHDVLRALGMKLGEDGRVRRDDDWQRALAEKKEFKGMWLLERKGIHVLDIECQRLSAVTVLAVGWWIRLTGECRVSLRKLRYTLVFKILPGEFRFSKEWMLSNTQLWNMTEGIHKHCGRMLNIQSLRLKVGLMEVFR